jgi:hypothetical protein
MVIQEQRADMLREKAEEKLADTEKKLASGREEEPRDVVENGSAGAIQA